jgi:hypothetical protein
MEDFDDAYINAEEKAFVRFDPNGMGEFHFGYVHGYMDCRSGQRDGKTAVEWSWDGNDEHHPAFGRGWAVLQDDSSLEGVICFHQSDEFPFRARKWPGGKTGQNRPGIIAILSKSRVRRLGR